MAGGGQSSCSLVFATLLLGVVLLSDLLSAGPIAPTSKVDEGTSLEEKASLTHRKLTRNRRNISWYKQHSDFWNWYKYFTDNGNQEAVQELDRIYLAYLQNKNRAEGRRSYKAYLRHLGDIYKSCADSNDPNCVASYTARPKPEPPKPAPVRTCDPTKDPNCLYAALLQGKSPYLPLVLPAAPVRTQAPVKAPGPAYMRSAAVKEPQSGYPYYAPAVQPFLSKEQKAELLRICSSDDVECLQYHLRAAYGYKPSAGPLPSYAHLGCDPKEDPNCKTQQAQKAPSGLYLQYPNCDPLRDPYCAYAASLPASRSPTGPGPCNPLYEDGCNPLTARRLASPPQHYPGGEQAEQADALRMPPPAAEQRRDPYAMFRDSPAHACDPLRDPYCQHTASHADPRSQSVYRSPPPASDPYAMLRQYMSQAHANNPYAQLPEATPEANANDPFAMFREAAAAMNRHSNPHGNHNGDHHPQQQYPFRQSHYEEPAQEQRHPLGPPGKTKEGHDCFIGYDRECFPLTSAERSAGRRNAPGPHEAYEPHLNADGSRNGVLEPSNPDCDPEYDRDCRLRRDEVEQSRAQNTPAPGEEEHYQVGAPESDQQEQYESEPYQSGQEEPYMAYPQQNPRMPSFQELLRSYGQQFPDQDDHRAYGDDYRKK